MDGRSWSVVQDPVGERRKAITDADVQGFRWWLSDEVERTALVQDFGVRLARVIAPEADRRRRAAESQIPEHHFGQPRREDRVHDEQVEVTRSESVPAVAGKGTGGGGLRARLQSWLACVMVNAAVTESALTRIRPDRCPPGLAATE